MKNKKSGSINLYIVGAVIVLVGLCIYRFADKKQKVSISDQKIVYEQPLKTSGSIPVEALDAGAVPEISAGAETPENTNFKRTQKPLDPLTKTILTFSRAVNESHERRLKEVFKIAGKEELFDSYMNLKRERDARVGEMLKKDNSRAALVKLNYEFHNKLFEILKDDLYKKYLHVLKQTNEEATRTKIVVEF